MNGLYPYVFVSALGSYEMGRHKQLTIIVMAPPFREKRLPVEQSGRYPTDPSCDVR